MNSNNGKKQNKDIEEDLAWEEITTEHIIQDKWIDFRKSAYRFPDGRVFEPYYSYSLRDYVVIVASDEEGKYLCVRQFRQGIREVTTEFPAGVIEHTDCREDGKKDSLPEAEDGLETAGRKPVKGEAALAAARRELLEETGYVSDDWKHLLTVPSHATIADNYAHIFLAAGCRRSREQSLDETEILKVRKYSPDEIERLIADGGFQQAVHIMAWLLAQRTPAL